MLWRSALSKGKGHRRPKAVKMKLHKDATGRYQILMYRLAGCSGHKKFPDEVAAFQRKLYV
tara:strand:+ start:1236 stop:1418 length:183 start_codon:yes stop_codon:yes gene_type:complete